jgi:hypothetical protein
MKTNSFILNLFFVIFILVSACKRGDDAKPQDNTPAVTEKGKPTGDAKLTEIGPDGGQATSANGTLTIDIPAGALDAKTMISVQPITNTAPGGSKTAFRLSPEGLTFKKPATLTFKYKDGDFPNSSPEAGWIVFQENDGTWKGNLKTRIDTDSKQMAIETMHFSDWGVGVLARLSIEPITSTALVNEKVTIKINGYFPPDNFKYPLEDVPNDAFLAGIYPGQKQVVITDKTAIWILDVDKAPATNKLGSLALNGDISSVIYTAPNKVPSVNPVPIIFQLEIPFTDKKGNRKKSTVNWNAYVTVIDPKESTVEWTVGGKTYMTSSSDGSGSILLTSTSNIISADISKGENKGASVYINLENSVPRVGTVSLSNEKNKDYVSISGSVNSGFTSIHRLYSKYEIQYRLADGSIGFCKSFPQEWKEFKVNFTKYREKQGDFVLVEGYFSGTLYTEPMPTKCESSQPREVSGKFFLRIPD